jgi:hypothetical protein
MEYPYIFAKIMLPLRILPDGGTEPMTEHITIEIEKCDKLPDKQNMSLLNMEITNKITSFMNLSAPLSETRSNTSSEIDTDNVVNLHHRRFDTSEDLKPHPYGVLVPNYRWNCPSKIQTVCRLNSSTVETDPQRGACSKLSVELPVENSNSLNFQSEPEPEPKLFVTKEEIKSFVKSSNPSKNQTLKVYHRSPYVKNKTVKNYNNE